jgi:glutathione S-transferase
MSMVLYGAQLSGHTHRVSLLLTLLGLPFQLEPTPPEKRRTQEFLALNPFGQIPVLRDGELVLPDSNAILVYLARRYDPTDRWLPRDPVGEALVQRWLSIAAGEIAYGLARARLARGFQRPGIDHRAALEIAERLLPLLDTHLLAQVAAGQPFVAAAHPTIADLAVYSYAYAAPEGGIALEPYAAILAWFERLEALPGFFRMPHIGEIK